MDIDIFNYKDIPLYVIDIPYNLSSKLTVFYTRIPWGEYKRIRFAERVQSIPPWDLKMKIFRDYTLRDPSWTDMEIDLLPAGVVDTISDLIMYVSDSGIIPDKNGRIDIGSFTYRLNMYRSIARTNVEYQMYTVICLVFKAYTFEMLDKLPFDKISSLFASAERYLLENGMLKQPLEIYNPEDQEEMNKEVASAKEPVKTNVPPDSEEGSFLKELLKVREQQEKQDLEKRRKENIIREQQNKISKEDENRNKVKEKISKTDYIPPKDSVAISNGVAVNVPGITINRQNQLGGFESGDFNGPGMTDAEALAMQMEMGLMPAGYELIIEKQEKEREEAAKVEKQKPNFKKRFKTKP
jgi:hypothetical protein